MYLNTFKLLNKILLFLKYILQYYNHHVISGHYTAFRRIRTDVACTYDSITLIKYNRISSMHITRTDDDVLSIKYHDNILLASVVPPYATIRLYPSTTLFETFTRVVRAHAYIHARISRRVTERAPSAEKGRPVVETHKIYIRRRSTVSVLRNTRKSRIHPYKPALAYGRRAIRCTRDDTMFIYYTFYAHHERLQYI